MLRIKELRPDIHPGYTSCLVGLPQHFRPESVVVTQWINDTKISCLYYQEYIFFERAEDATYAFLYFSGQEFYRNG